MSETAKHTVSSTVRYQCGIRRRFSAFGHPQVSYIAPLLDGKQIAIIHH